MRKLVLTLCLAASVIVCGCKPKPDPAPAVGGKMTAISATMNSFVFEFDPPSDWPLVTVESTPVRCWIWVQYQTADGTPTHSAQFDKYDCMPPDHLNRAISRTVDPGWLHPVKGGWFEIKASSIESSPRWSPVGKCKVN